MFRLNQVAHYFSPEDQSAGQLLALRGNVLARDVEDYYLRLEVNDDGVRLDVILAVRQGQLLIDCECRHPADGRSCEHMWSAFWFLERTQSLHLPDVTRRSLIRFTPDTKGFGHGGERTLSWRGQLANVGLSTSPPPPSTAGQEDGQLIFRIAAFGADKSHGIHLFTETRRRKVNGGWSLARAKQFDASAAAALQNPHDRNIISLLVGAKEEAASAYSYAQISSPPTDRFKLTGNPQRLLMPILCSTERCFWSPDTGVAPDQAPLKWDDSLPWRLVLKVTGHGEPQSPLPSGATQPDSTHYLLNAALQRGDERIALSDTRLRLTDNLVLYNNVVSPLDASANIQWARALRRDLNLHVPLDEGSQLLEYLLSVPGTPELDLPEELSYKTVAGSPTPRLHFKGDRPGSFPRRVTASLTFQYDSSVVVANALQRGIYEPDSKRYILRDMPAEQAAAAHLTDLGFRARVHHHPDERELGIAETKMPRIARQLLSEGWIVEADGKLYHKPVKVSFRVTSGIDWFDLEGTVEFEGGSAPVPELLAAIKRGSDTVRLSDGSVGVLPEDWIAKYKALAKLGTSEDGHLRFTRSQAGLLDALLLEQPEVDCDADFLRLRERLQNFQQIVPYPFPKTFKGERRPYQEECLGWFHFLEQLGMGGCLADDMGVGKTIEVLAWLEVKRLEYKAALKSAKTDKTVVVSPRTSLVAVLPTNVVNWIDEAKLFTPQLRVFDYTDATRHATCADFAKYDVVITTPGILLRDIRILKECVFNYAILDEPEAIRNASTQTSKAARLLNCRNRLVLTGTPVENHLAELWSLFEFINPGMLGKANVLGLSSRNPDPHTLEIISAVVRPFILRRTKDQTGKELPPAQEKILHCDLTPTERERYNELREYFRAALLQRIDREGINRSGIHIFQALTRLRQAACHPGLMDKEREGESSAKLELLLEQLRLVLEEDHKVLVFSQFTSLLLILRKHLDKAGIKYEFIAGQTPKKKRGEIIKRFQTDPSSRLFLIALKAGGRGPNITAADYVYLLDPWWNPFAESQAISRAHRPGQKRSVFAYRIIAKDTIEEKVLKLQDTKRELADAIVNNRNGMIRSLQREDVEFLFSAQVA